MPVRNDISFGTISVDELFTSQQDRDEAKLKKIYDIPLIEIDPFPDHPYLVKDDEDMDNLIESIKQYGILTPATIRKKEDGRYEMLSGHRRMRACAKAGIKTLRCEVVDLDRDAAILFMVDSNLQRTTILPSEKAHAYKMRLEAMHRQAGRRSSENGAPVEPHSLSGKSRDILADEVGESREQVRRYVRLNELIPGLLDLVDENKIGLRPAVEISYFPKDKQEALLESIDIEQATPTHAQTIQMRKMLNEGKLTDEVIEVIMQQEKPNQKDRFVIKDQKIIKMLEKYPIAARSKVVADALEAWERRQERERIRDDDDRER